MQTSENIRKNNLLEEVISNFDKDTIILEIGKDSDTHVLERERYKKMISGFMDGDSKYSNLHEKNIDYFLSILVPLHEKNVVKTVEDFVKVVEGVNGKVDNNRINDKVINGFNESYCDFKSRYPLFNFADESTFDIQEGLAYKEFVSLLYDVYEEHADKDPFSFDAYRKILNEKLSAKEIADTIYKTFDELQTQIAWRILSGKLENYTDKLRDEIAKFVAKNPNDPNVKFILKESFNEAKEIKEEDIEDYVSRINENSDIVYKELLAFDAINKSQEEIIDFLNKASDFTKSDASKEEIDTILTMHQTISQLVEDVND